MSSGDFSKSPNYCNILVFKKVLKCCKFFCEKKCSNVVIFWLKTVAFYFNPKMFDARHTCQENESEILSKKMKKSVVFRCRKNYRLDLLRCMREILKLKKNDFWLFWTQKNVSLFWSKKRHIFWTLFVCQKKFRFWCFFIFFQF